MARKSPNSQPSRLGQILMLVLQDFQRRLDEDLKSRRVRGIKARHRDVFLYLGQHGASRAVDIASALGVRPQSMMKIVHELEDMGFLERRQDPDDSRAKLIDFSPDGKDFVEELSLSTETVWQQYEAILGKTNMRHTIDNLTTVLDGKNND